VRGAGIELIRDGRTVSTIAAPRAVDAQGEAVPTSMELDGDSLRITLSRGDRDWAYPILVDPAIDSYAWADFPGWSGFNTGNYSLSGDCMFGHSCFGPAPGQYQGLNVYAWQGQWYPSGATAGFRYRAPSNYGVAIVRATLGWVGFWNGESTGTPYMLGRLVDDANGQNAHQEIYGSSWFGTFDFSRIGDSPYVKEVDVGLGNLPGYDRYAQADHHAYVGTATIYLDDTDVPGFGNISRPPWVDQKPAPIPLAVTDTGLGIASLTVSVANGGPSWTTPVGCAGGTRSPCPNTWSSPANGSPNYDPSVLPQGTNNLTVTATDAAGHVSPNPGHSPVRVDHTDPTLDLSGSLTTLSQSQSGGN
jgi:hypothetical protein